MQRPRGKGTPDVGSVEVSMRVRRNRADAPCLACIRACVCVRVCACVCVCVRAVCCNSNTYGASTQRGRETFASRVRVCERYACSVGSSASGCTSEQA